MTDRSLRGSFRSSHDGQTAQGVDVVRIRDYNFHANTINLSANYVGIGPTVACDLAESVTGAGRKNHHKGYAA